MKFPSTERRSSSIMRVAADQHAMNPVFNQQPATMENQDSEEQEVGADISQTLMPMANLQLATSF